MKEEKELPYSELTSAILGCCFDVMRELGPGFLEKVYKNALLIAMIQKWLEVKKVIGRYNADLVVGRTVIIELKCCESLIREHQAQLFNYLKVSGLPIGLLVNFRRRKLEWKRLQSNEEWFNDEDEIVEELAPFWIFFYNFLSFLSFYRSYRFSAFCVHFQFRFMRDRCTTKKFNYYQIFLAGTPWLRGWVKQQLTIC